MPSILRMLILTKGLLIKIILENRGVGMVTFCEIYISTSYIFIPNKQKVKYGYGNSPMTMPGLIES